MIQTLLFVLPLPYRIKFIRLDMKYRNLTLYGRESLASVKTGYERKFLKTEILRSVNMAD